MGILQGLPFGRKFGKGIVERLLQMIRLINKDGQGRVEALVADVF